jgi:predicted ATPase/DNA-binding XRE family transcriptional regulator
LLSSYERAFNYSGYIETEHLVILKQNRPPTIRSLTDTKSDTKYHEAEMTGEDSFGTWLKQRRRLLDLTQQQVADSAGCSVVTIRKFEIDERRPSRQLAELMAACLQILPQDREQFVAFARALESATPPPSLLTPPVLPSPPPAVPLPAPASVLPLSLHLPAPMTSLLGREREIESITAMWQQSGVRLLTLTGPGGTGKTQLALEAARRWAAGGDLFPDGVAFVDLSAVFAPEQVLPTIAAVLGVKESLGKSVTDSLNSVLQARRMLLLLDNFEQVVEAAPHLLALLHTNSGLRMAVTSRILLHLYGEHEFPVLPLRVPPTGAMLETNDYQKYPSLLLFMERACAVNPSFVLTPENIPDVAEICRRLDGLPLAIELAAARSKFLPPATQLAQLSDRLNLTTSNRSATDRQRTLRAAIAWSFNLLDVEEQQLFARLGIFAGEFTLAAVAAVSGQDPGDMLLSALLDLADKNMIRVGEATATEPIPSFSLLLTLRDYAQEQLVQLNELETTQAAHAHYYLSLVQEAAAHYQGPELSVWLHRLESAHDNLRAALAWSMQSPERIVTGLSLAIGLAHFWRLRNHTAEGRRWFDILLAAADAAPLSLRAMTYRTAGTLAHYRQDSAAAEALLQKSLVLWQSLGVAGNEVEMGTTLNLLGAVAWAQEEYGIARTYYEQTLTLRERLGNQRDTAQTLYNLGLLDQHQAQYASAYAHYQQSLALDQASGDQVGILHNLNAMGTTSQELGEYAAARAHLMEGLAISRKLNDEQTIAMILGNLGNVALPEGKLDDARDFYEEGLALARRVESRTFTAMNLFGLGTLSVLAGDDAGAGPRLREALTLWHGLGNKRLMIRTLDVFALLFSRHGQAEVAMNLLGFAEKWRENALLPPRSPAFKPFYKQALDLVRAHLDENALAEAWEKGRSLAVDRVLALILSIPDPKGTHLDLPAIATSSRFVAEGLLAVGGMGELYRGKETTTGQQVVIKRLKPELVYAGSEAVARFVREGEMLRQLDHPNIVKFLAVEMVNGEVHLIMEYVPGGSLRDVLNLQAQLPIARIITLALELADALSRAHHLGIVHRDLKPENVLLAANGSPRLTDFGIAYQMFQQSRLTQPGMVMGTTAYLSPEACQGAELDSSSDLWSFGVLLYEMLTGRNPFEAGNVLATMLATLHEPLPDLTQSRPDTPPELVLLVNRLLVKERSQRLGSIRQVAAELERIQSGVLH